MGSNGFGYEASLKRLFTILLIIALLFSACSGNNKGVDADNHTEQNDTSMINSTLPENPGEETEAVNERLITKEELFEYIQSNDVGLTIEDFEGIDVEDFLVFWQFTPSNIGNYLCKASLEMYLDDLGIKERTRYFAKEKISVESTDEEYENFIEKFFKATNEEVVSAHYEKATRFYRYKTDKAKDFLYIARTKDINDMNIINDPARNPELIVVLIPIGDAHLRGNLCYSKNNKFMLLSDPVYEWMYEYIKVFREIDD